MTLDNEVKKLVDYINSIELAIEQRPPSSKHVGAIIADAVLQVGHKWKILVSPRIDRIITNYPKANNISELSLIIKAKEVKEFLNWKGEDVQGRFIKTVEFFKNEQINTFDELYEWLEKEKNRDRLVTKGTEINKAGIPKIGDATADYYRVLVRLPDAVKVDSLVKEFLTEAGIKTSLYKYKELRTIVQLAAKELNKRPLDLDGAIWNYMENKSQNNKRRKSMNSEENGSDIDSEEETTSNKKRLPLKEAEEFANENGFAKEAEYIKSLAKYGISYKARESLFMRLFQGKGKWNEFLKKWPNGNKEDGGKKIEAYTKLSENLKLFLCDISQEKERAKLLNIINGKAIAQLGQPVTQSQTTNQITLSLSDKYIGKLDKLAQECDTDINTLASILLVIQLRQ